MHNMFFFIYSLFSFLYINNNKQTNLSATQIGESQIHYIKNGNISNSQGRRVKLIDLHCVVVQCRQIMFVEREVRENVLH